MPTGYTAKLMEHGQTFQEFAMLCARAFGACIEMRDSSLDTPIPEKFQPSDYHVKALESAKKDLARLSAMSKKERIAYGEAEKQKKIAASRQALEKDEQQNARLNGMASQVSRWQPPTPKHEGLRAFMLEQIGVSKQNTDFWLEEIKEAESKSPMAYWQEAIKSAKHYVQYHEKENGKEIGRAASRTQWVRQLRESLQNFQP